MTDTDQNNNGVEVPGAFVTEECVNNVASQLTTTATSEQWMEDSSFMVAATNVSLAEQLLPEETDRNSEFIAPSEVTSDRSDTTRPKNARGCLIS